MSPASPQPSKRTDPALQVARGERRCWVARGDCLRLGHRVPAGSVAATIVDPPFGMRWSGRGGKSLKIKNDDRPFVWWLRGAYEATAETGALACFCNWTTKFFWRQAIEAAGYTVRSEMIWHRDWPGLGSTRGARIDHETIWLATKGRWSWPGAQPSTVLRHRKPGRERRHPTEKPQALLRELVERMTAPGDLVYDPTMGSGSTGVAALSLKRRFIGFELDPDHFAVARRRVREAQPRGVKAKRARGLRGAPGSILPAAHPGLPGLPGLPGPGLLPGGVAA